MPHTELREYQCTDRPSERFDYNLQAVLNLLEPSRETISNCLGRVLSEPFDAVSNLSFAAGEASYAVGLLSPEVEFKLGSTFVAQFRALASSSRVLWEIMNDRQLHELRLSKSRNLTSKVVGKMSAQKRRQNEDSLAVATVRESFSLLLTDADREALRPPEVDELDKLFLSTSLNDPADDLCALLEKADFSTSSSTRAPVAPPPPVPKKSAWEQLAATVTLYKNEWVIAPPPDILLPGEQSPGGFCHWVPCAPLHYSQTRRKPKRESSSDEEESRRFFNPYSQKGRGNKAARDRELEKRLLFDQDLRLLCGGGALPSFTLHRN